MPMPNPHLHVALSETNEELLRSFDRALRAEGKSLRTRQSYLEAARLLAGHSGAELDRISRSQCQQFLSYLIENMSHTTAAVRYRSLQQLFAWIIAEEFGMEVSPLTHLKPPRPTSRPVPVLQDEQLRSLVAACAGRDIYDKRDEAVVRLFIDTGMRVGEMVGLRVEDVDMRQDQVTIRGKGRKHRTVPFGTKSGTALERYLRLRSRHPLAPRPYLWIGSRGGALTSSGISQMLQRRAHIAKLEGLHPHMFRHTAAHHAMSNGMGDDAIMRLFGWSTREMLNRYGASAAEDRARRAHRELAPGDRI